MSVQVRRINQNIGAEISGVDLSQTLSDADFQAIYDAWINYEVIIFRDQDITVEQQIAFGRRFGELTIHPFSPNMDEHREVIVLDNHNANPPALTDQWHSDETFRAEPPTATILRAEIVPAIGGDTMFASMTAAYAGLSPRLQHYLSGLTAIHDFKPFRTLFSGKPEARARLRKMEDDYPNPSHPVVRRHPVSGRPILNVNPQFTQRVEGLSAPESELLLNFLYQQATIPEYQLRVQWQPHTIVMWDNRSTQHYAVHDYYPQRRRMLRITVKGEPQQGIADTMAGIEAIATLADRKEGFKSERGEMVTRESERSSLRSE
ncbi:MAG: TauD/TfdA family dioxygenase [Anaerolineales bacterium]|nr:TauD/TfdA family dioxygenase [Anaerolineales bacterium]